MVLWFLQVNCRILEINSRGVAGFKVSKAQQAEAMNEHEGCNPERCRMYAVMLLSRSAQT